MDQVRNCRCLIWGAVQSMWGGGRRLLAIFGINQISILAPPLQATHNPVARELAPAGVRSSPKKGKCDELNRASNELGDRSAADREQALSSHSFSVRVLTLQPFNPGIKRLGELFAVIRVMAAPMTVRTKRYSIADSIRTLIRQMLHVMNFKVRRVIFSERRRFTAPFTYPFGFLTDPGSDLRVTYIGCALGGSALRLQNPRWFIFKRQFL